MLTIDEQQMGLGWLPDYPDFRDYTREQDEVPALVRAAGSTKTVKTMLREAGLESPAKVSMPTSVDLRQWCSPVENQGSLGSCTANAGVGMLEYFERRAFGRHIDASRLFLYKVTRDLMHVTGDTGAYLRTTMGSLALFGVPPEEYWPYNVPTFDTEPPAFCYGFAQNYRALQYFRLDPPGTAPQTVVDHIKANVVAGIPAMFGFTVYVSISQAATSGKIPCPGKADKVAGGHAMLVVGYDDAVKIQNSAPGEPEYTGAFLVRNSWGASWGLAGYGYLPYQYVLGGLATDWWSILKSDWIETGQFHV